jgi:hypothetical protein
MSPRKPKTSEDDDIDFLAPARAAKERRQAQETQPAPAGLPAPTSDPNHVLSSYSNNIVDSKVDNLVIGTSEVEGQEKAPFTYQELVFLHNYLVLRMNKTKSMRSAGYQYKHIPSYINQANKVLVRYEEWAGSAAKIFRRAGVGETRLALKVDKLLDDGSKRIQMDAAKLLASILRATEPPETVDRGMAININIIQAPAQAPAPGPPPEPPGSLDHRKRLPPTAKPLQITK